MTRTLSLLITAVLLASAGRSAESLSLRQAAPLHPAAILARGLALAGSQPAAAARPDFSAYPRQAANATRAHVEAASLAADGKQSGPAEAAKPASGRGETAATGDSPGGQTTSGASPAVQDVSQEPVTTSGQLPQTSTILPLLGLIGLGSLVAGFFARR